MSPYRLTKIEAPTRLVLAFRDAFNQHNVSGLMALTNRNAVLEHFEPPPDGAKYQGEKEIRQLWETIFEKNPSLQLKIEELSQAGYRVILWWRFEWEGLQTKSATLRGITVFNTMDGKIQEMMSYTKGEL